MVAIVTRKTISFNRIESFTVRAHLHTSSILQEIPIEAGDAFSSIIVLFAVDVVSSQIGQFGVICALALIECVADVAVCAFFEEEVEFGAEGVDQFASSVVEVVSG